MDEGDLVGFGAVGRAFEVSGGGAGEAGEALELESGEDVVIDLVAVLPLDASVKGGEARGEEEGGAVDGGGVVVHMEVDGTCGANGDTLAAAGAEVHIDEPGIGHGAEAWWAVDGLGGREPALVVVGAGDGADGGAEATIVALVRVDEAGLVEDGGGEGAWGAKEVGEEGVGEEGDVVVGVALEGGAEGGLVRQHEADAAGVGGEGVV
jgi:hypothetical protein